MVALRMLGVGSPAENDGAFCLFGVCVSCLFKSNCDFFYNGMIGNVLS